ncbi:MAG: hypothetical protein M0C28_22780 [Candidatus Moduliflexus flocculans]|nr:hypothetical protein [Candidatus Moduliflexus flocculans]
MKLEDAAYRLREFWEEFRKERNGLVGLGILAAAVLRGALRTPDPALPGSQHAMAGHHLLAGQPAERASRLDQPRSPPEKSARRRGSCEAPGRRGDGVRRGARLHLPLRLTTSAGLPTT